MLRSVFLPTLLALTVSPSEAQLSLLESALLPITQGKPLVLPAVGLTGVSLVSPDVLRYLTSGGQKEQAPDTVSFRWQIPTPVTFCSRKSLQVLELREAEVLSIQPFQKGVRGQPLFCATVEPIQETGSRELYVDIDGGGQVDLWFSFVGTGEQATPLVQLKPVLVDSPELSILTLPAGLLGGEESLRLDMSGVRPRKAPNGRGGEHQQGKGDPGSPPSYQEATGGQGGATAGGSGGGDRGGGASGAGDGDNPKKPGAGRYLYKVTPDYFIEHGQYSNLLEAIRHKNLKMFKKILLEYDLSLMARDADEISLLEHAINHGAFEIVSFIIDNIDLDSDELSLNFLLIKIITNRFFTNEEEEALLRLLLEKGAQPSGDNFLAVIRNRSSLAVIQAFMEAGVKPDTSHLLAAINSSSLIVVQTLLKAGVKPDTSHFLAAIGRYFNPYKTENDQNYEIILFLIRIGIPINAETFREVLAFRKDRGYSSPKLEKVISLMIDNHVDDFDTSYLNVAIQTRLVTFVERILKNNPNIELHSSHLEQALYSWEMQSLLMQYGARFSATKLINSASTLYIENLSVEDISTLDEAIVIIDDQIKEYKRRKNRGYKEKWHKQNDKRQNKLRKERKEVLIRKKKELESSLRLRPLEPV